MSEVAVSKVLLSPQVGMMSLVGIRDDHFPLKFGNYCSIADGPYLCNMWAENLTEWARRNPGVDKIEVTVVEHMGRSIGFVSDERLKDWCNSEFCITGNGWPSVAAMRVVCKELGVAEDVICGCEKETDVPHVAVGWKSDSRQYWCWRCKRSWDAN